MLKVVQAEQVRGKERGEGERGKGSEWRGDKRGVRREFWVTGPPIDQ